MNSDFIGPVNIGSEEMIKINDLVKMVSNIANKKISINNVPGPTGVRGRNSDNLLFKEKIRWVPEQKLIIGIEKTYKWIQEQLQIVTKK
jgi:nucleoside-diphosphate-sugar epimerase